MTDQPWEANPRWVLACPGDGCKAQIGKPCVNADGLSWGNGIIHQCRADAIRDAKHAETSRLIKSFGVDCLHAGIVSSSPEDLPAANRARAESLAALLANLGIPPETA